MRNELRTRLGVLFGLAVVGVGLGVAGIAVGVTGPVIDAGPHAAFTVTDEDVTFSNGDRETTVVENLSETQTVEVRAVDSGRYEVRTRAERPLTDGERERAKAVARRNATVRRYLDDAGDAELAVEPIRKLNASSSGRIDGTVTAANESGAGETFEVTVENGTTGAEDGSVVVYRERSYVANEASVRVRNAASGELKYTVHVDLTNESVVGVTDWAAIREG